MIKKILKGLGVLVGLLLVAVGGLFWRASAKLSTPVEAPLPPITAATEPQALDRGKIIFLTVCANCHTQDSSGRVAGGQMTDLPPFLGAIQAANLTSHPTAGVGSLKDAELARAVRYGVRRDGKRLLIMPALAMSDADLASLVGFMRSGDAIFAPDGRVPPPSGLSAVGTLALGLLQGPVPLTPTSGVQSPPKGPTPEYGRYLAFDVYNCAGCHSPGLGAERVFKPEAFSGGGRFQTTAGRVYSTNLTFDESGLGQWTLEQFSRALREGITPEGHAVRDPMPRTRGLDDTDAEALYRFLQSLPKQASKPLPKDAVPRTKVTPQAAPEQLFTQLGCVSCHGEGGKYRAMLKRSRERSVAEVARWIRNPEVTAPGTPMPTYAQLLDETQALSLATWVQQHATQIP